MQEDIELVPLQSHSGWRPMPMIYVNINRFRIAWPIYIEKCISATLHVFIMGVFEIFFYFYYIVKIEKQLFIDKLELYLHQLGRAYAHTPDLHLLYRWMIHDPYLHLPYDDIVILDMLYNQYQDALAQQRRLLATLLKRACIMTGMFGILLGVFIFGAMYRRIHIPWKWIMFENALMFFLLGVFELLFFTYIILRYSPITDAEIKYMVASYLYSLIVSNTTRITL